jgi:hypothetical protein
MNSFFFLVLYLFAGSVKAAVCTSSVIHCSDQGDGSPWVDGNVGCALFFEDFGADPLEAICDNDRCKYKCGSFGAMCDLNQGCNVGICNSGGCATGIDCHDTEDPWKKCNNFRDYTATYSLPTWVDCTFSFTTVFNLLNVSCNVSRTDFDITFCDGSCSPVCPPDSGILEALGIQTCTECLTGSECANQVGRHFCDRYTKYYTNELPLVIFPGDPPRTLGNSWDYNKCVVGCNFFLSDARVGIYVNYTDFDNFFTYSPAQIPPGREPIAIAGGTIRAKPGQSIVDNACIVPLTNADCGLLNGGPYIRSIATLMGDFDLVTNAAYCVDRCPDFAGGEAVGIDSCRICNSALANGCQYRGDANNVCDSFIKYFPGDPFNVVELNICTTGCHGAVNGSGWSPCEPTGGCCDRCDTFYNCLWRCSNGPKCNYDAFVSPLDSDLIGACMPMCDPSW